MKKIKKKWFNRLDISTGLQLSFALSAFFCLFIGAIGLYTWQQQRTEIVYAIDQNFPKVQAAFRTEEQINLLENAFARLTEIKNTNDRIEWQNHTQSLLDALKTAVSELNTDSDESLLKTLQKQTALLATLSENIEEHLKYDSELHKTLTEINWLHNDFHSEFIALLQEISWQQSTLANHIAQNPHNINQIELLKKRQQELLNVYDFISYEEQIVSELKAQINRTSALSEIMLDNFLNYSARLIKQKIDLIAPHSSIYTIKQIMDELLAIGLDKQALPYLLERKKQLDIAQRQLIDDNDSLLHELRSRITMQVGNSKKQLQLLHNIIDKSTKINGIIILSAMLLVFIFVISINFFYIRLRLLKRFQLLNQSVVRLINGENNVRIAVYGNDELGRIAKLLRLFSFAMNKKNNELKLRNETLSSEIQDRIKIQNELINTQNELIQAAKLAVVGQTLTSINHEITQPLNAMNAYIFSAKKALQKQNNESVLNYLEKIEHLIDRTAVIVKRLRHFSRQGSNKLQQVNLRECIQNAWDLLESKHRNLKARLHIPPELPYISGEEVLVEQVFVNLFLNSLEACGKEAPQIKIEIQAQSEEKICLWISDNGEGWPLTDKLLQPFSSSKSIHLGLGLSISSSIMKQCSGTLYIASTLTHNALVILQFKVKQYAQ